MLNTKDKLHTKWPKMFLPLTPGQQVISDDFMQYWHEVLPSNYGIVDKFNHNYVVKNASQDFSNTLEIGAGSGEHLKYELLNKKQKANYVAVDIRKNMVAELHNRFPEIKAIVGDCQMRLNFEDDHFDRILDIHVLEHLPNLPAAIREMHRLCNKDKGVLSIVIPCEGSLAYSIARKISAQRIFEKRYKQSYNWFIEREHINIPSEILQELAPYFTLVSTSYFPIPVKLEFCNLCIGATFKPKVMIDL